MNNVKMHLSPDGRKLTIEIDLTQEFGPSQSGKTIVVASTSGNKAVGETGIYLGLNAYKYPPRRSAVAASRLADLNLD